MKPFIDRDGRIFGLVSVVDLLVLIFLVLAGVSLYLKANVLDTTQTAQSHDLSAMDTVSVQVLVSNVSDFVADALEIGDEVYDQGNFDAGVLGTISDIQIQDASYIAELSNGLRAVVSGAGSAWPPQAASRLRLKAPARARARKRLFIRGSVSFFLICSLLDGGRAKKFPENAKKKKFF